MLNDHGGSPCSSRVCGFACYCTTGETSRIRLVIALQSELEQIVSVLDYLKCDLRKWLETQPNRRKEERRGGDPSAAVQTI
jgi:hypothetical protein